MDALLPYYDRELAFLRRYAPGFAERYPKIAPRLAFADRQSDDPHVERMIDALALLGARINRKLDDDYPELAEALLEVLYPHYLRPFPSCSVAQFAASGAERIDEVVTIPRGAQFRSREVNGVRCCFRTAYDVTLAPIRLACAQFRALGELPAHTPVLPGDASGVISFSFESTSSASDLAAIGLDLVRAYLHGEQSFVATLADSLFMKAIAAYVEADEPGEWRRLPALPLEQAGFTDTQSLIDYPAKSHPAYRLLTEYFAFPEKFGFIDFDLAAMLRASRRCRRLTLHVVIGRVRGETQVPRLIESLGAHHLRLFCSPVVNLFKQPGEPIHVSHEVVSYPVVANARNAPEYEVYSIDAVHLVREGANEQTIMEFRPFYALHHDEADKAGRYWFARRNASVADMSPGYETEISIIERAFDPSSAQTDTLSLELTCTNRDLPARLAIGLEGGDLFLDDSAIENEAALTIGAEPVSMLCRPTPTVRVERGASMQLRLVSHLALGHAPLVDDDLASLKELLSLYDLRHTAVSTRHIEGLVGVERRPAVQWLPGKPFATFVRGVEIRLTIDEAHFVGTSVAAFVKVLDAFFGLYVNLNRFVQLIAVSKRTGEEIMRCKPRSAESTLV